MRDTFGIEPVTNTSHSSTLSMAELGENTQQLDPAIDESIQHSTASINNQQDDKSTSEPHNDEAETQEGVEGSHEMNGEEQAVLDPSATSEQGEQSESWNTRTLIQHKRISFKLTA